jgi:hypothetical protein
MFFPNCALLGANGVKGLRMKSQPFAALLRSTTARCQAALDRCSWYDVLKLRRLIRAVEDAWHRRDGAVEIEEYRKERGARRLPNSMINRDEQFPGEAPGGIAWAEWLQAHRIELNAMTTPQFIEWLDAEMAEQGGAKLIPPDNVVAKELEDRLGEKVRDIVMERILREVGYEDQVTKALAEIERPDAAALKAGIDESFAANQENEWRVHIRDHGDRLNGGR